MMAGRRAFWRLAVLLLALAAARGQETYRICVVEKFNSTKKASTYCTVLDEKGSQASCVLGQSRLDCFRKITKNKADFAVFPAEDILAASHYGSDEVAVTNNIRVFSKQPFQMQVAAVVRKAANITYMSDLRGQKFCHPGYGYSTDDWTQLFEQEVVPQRCEQALTVAENRLKSSSEFFKSACKAGPWAPDQAVDRRLKERYHNLCALCDDPDACATTDKYWERRGPLFCLTDGVGDVAWARLDDIDLHFGISSHVEPVTAAKDFSLLCPDGRQEPLDTPQHCTWMSRPWPAVVARKKVTQSIQKLISSLQDAKPHSWQWALLHLVESFNQDIVPLDKIMPLEDYLHQAPGFLKAYSLPACRPPRTVRVCTRSNVEAAKCRMLAQAAQALGVWPDLACVPGVSAEECALSVQEGNADVTVTLPQWQHVARRKYKLKPLLFEFSPDTSALYEVAAVVKAGKGIRNIQDLKGKKACFPSYDGVGWNTMVSLLKNNGLLTKSCPFSAALGEFFSEACVPGLNATSNMNSLCPSEINNTFAGEAGAFKCLASGKGDVAFISMNTVKKYTDGNSKEAWAKDLKSAEFRPLCTNGSSPACFLSWATPGQVMVYSNISSTRHEEIYLTFLTLQDYFGKKMKTPGMFQLFSAFDNYSNVLFQDRTERLDTLAGLQREKPLRHNYERMLEALAPCSGALPSSLPAALVAALAATRLFR
ncbi:transferrin-like isoform X2 [Bacillus rossius redtenbacheri]|uniref:transferrin-like isoform X2 n=1 Tax=Bacillus rossius redtenbacheri TaxID=93214 RepID=UPI002FDE5D99